MSDSIKVSEARARLRRIVDKFDAICLLYPLIDDEPLSEIRVQIQDDDIAMKPVNNGLHAQACNAVVTAGGVQVYDVPAIAMGHGWLEIDVFLSSTEFETVKNSTRFVVSVEDPNTKGAFLLERSFENMSLHSQCERVEFRAPWVVRMRFENALA